MTSRKRYAPDPGEPRIIPQPVYDWLYAPCTHHGGSRLVRCACTLCFADAVLELLALRERQAAGDAAQEVKP